jgi:molybdopterin synthase catalytic subunit
MTTAYTVSTAIDYAALYGEFIDREEDRDGTVVLHHGRVKRPGKQVASFSAVELVALVPGVDEGLAGIAREAEKTFGLGQVLIVHRLGRVKARESILLVVVSAPTRKPCFEACAWIVDEIKKESLVRLVEIA